MKSKEELKEMVYKCKYTEVFTELGLRIELLTGSYVTIYTELRLEFLKNIFKIDIHYIDRLVVFISSLPDVEGVDDKIQEKEPKKTTKTKYLVAVISIILLSIAIFFTGSIFEKYKKNDNIKQQNLIYSWGKKWTHYTATGKSQNPIYGDIIINITSDTTIEGSYTNLVNGSLKSRGIIKGNSVANGKILKGTWKNIDKNITGEFEFNLTSEYNSFTGYYNLINNNDTSVRYSWSGVLKTE
jgi:hypothetical protein